VRWTVNQDASALCGDEPAVDLSLATDYRQDTVTFSSLDWSRSGFVDATLPGRLLAAKSRFDVLSSDIFERCRRDSSPYESAASIRSIPFSSRTTLKMAEIDHLAAVSEGFFERESDRRRPARVVAVSAAPYAEFLTWAAAQRGRALPRCVIMSLAVEGSFTPTTFRWAVRPPPQPRSVEFCRGPSGTGDVTYRKDVESLRPSLAAISSSCGGADGMADIVVCDTAETDVSADWNKQALFCKRPLLMQVALALHMTDVGGSAVIRVHDPFTDFAVGLLWLLSRHFSRFALIKPLLARAASSERYAVATGRLPCPADEAVEYLFSVNQKFEQEGADVPEDNDAEFIDVTHVVAPSRFARTPFASYMRAANDTLSLEQLGGIHAILRHASNPELPPVAAPDRVVGLIKSTGVPIVDDTWKTMAFVLGDRPEKPSPSFWRREPFKRVTVKRVAVDFHSFLKSLAPVAKTEAPLAPAARTLSKAEQTRQAMARLRARNQASALTTVAAVSAEQRLEEERRKALEARAAAVHRLSTSAARPGVKRTRRQALEDSDSDDGVDMNALLAQSTGFSSKR
jgi:23S rRNA U2552 (ribose-2'-O)-methylase RlmE/FtsJ